MLLHHDDLEQLNTYTRELSRLMFRSLFGCGVICGLAVKTDQKCGKVFVTVEAGLALDCSGDPVHVPKEQRLSIDEECDPSIPSPLWVVLCGTAKCCAPRTSMCASDEDEAPPVCTRERDGFEIRIVSKLPGCICGCRYGYPAYPETRCKCVDPDLACYRDHYAGKCGCNAGDGCDCSCECILLARLDKGRTYDQDQTWMVDHSVRRFVRPVLMRDPLVQKEEEDRAETPAVASPAPEPTGQPTRSPKSAKAKQRA
jgi:hypothetical protein